MPKRPAENHRLDQMANGVVAFDQLDIILLVCTFVLGRYCLVSTFETCLGAGVHVRCDVACG